MEFNDDLLYHYLDFLSQPNTIPIREQNEYIHRVILGHEEDILLPDYTGDFTHACRLVPRIPIRGACLRLVDKARIEAGEAPFQQYLPGDFWRWMLISPKPGFVDKSRSSHLYEVRVFSPHDYRMWSGKGATPALAMCVASLKARNDNKHIYR